MRELAGRSSRKIRETHKSDIREQVREYPYPRTGDDDSDEIEYEPYNRDPEKQANQLEHAHAQGYTPSRMIGAQSGNITPPA